MPVKTDLPKPRHEMTEADWTTYNQTRYRTWYDCGGIILFNRYGDVLVVQDKQSKKWSFPKGAAELQDQEKPMMTAIRECYEEVGLIPLTDYVWTSYKKHTQFFVNKQIYYYATIQEGCETHACVNDDEGAQVRWCTIDELRTMDCNIGIRRFIQTSRNN